MTTSLFISSADAVDVDPLRLEMTIPTDQPSRSTLTISNSGPKTVSVHIRPGPYRFWQTESTRPPSAESWFTFEPSGALTLAPGASQKVACIVTPPSAVREGKEAEYVAALLVDELPAEEEKSSGNGAQITVVPRLALPVYLQIQGRNQIHAEIVDLTLKAAGDKPGLLQAEIALENKGAVHIRPSGTLMLFQHAGHSVIHSTPLGKALPLFASSALKIPAAVPMPPPGQYKAVATIYLEPDKVIQKEKNFEISPNGKVQ